MEPESMDEPLGYYDTSYLEADSPGRYVIIHDNAAVRASVELDSPIVIRLPVGAVVEILEVVFHPWSRRVRGRLSQNGWISLLETEINYRWALKEADFLALSRDRQQALMQVQFQQYNTIMQELGPKFERLCAERQVVYDKYAQRIQTVEARLRLLQQPATVSEGVTYDAQRMATVKYQSAYERRLEAERKEREELLQNPCDPTLPPGAKVVGIRRIDLTEEERACLPAPRASPPVREQEAQTGSIQQVLQHPGELLYPSQLQPPQPKWVTQQGFMANVYPMSWPSTDVTRAGIVGPARYGGRPSW